MRLRMDVLEMKWEMEITRKDTIMPSHTQDSYTQPNHLLCQGRKSNCEHRTVGLMGLRPEQNGHENTATISNWTTTIQSIPHDRSQVSHSIQEVPHRVQPQVNITTDQPTLESMVQHNLYNAVSQPQQQSPWYVMLTPNNSLTQYVQTSVRYVERSRPVMLTPTSNPAQQVHAPMRYMSPMLRYPTNPVIHGSYLQTRQPEGTHVSHMVTIYQQDDMVRLTKSMQLLHMPRGLW